MSTRYIAPTTATPALARKEVAAPRLSNARDVIDPRIDPCAQFSLLRLQKSGPTGMAAGQGLLAAVKNGELAGIFGENLRVSSVIAARLGTVWWRLIPPGEDAALVVDPAAPTAVAPTIVFRSTQTRATRTGDPQACLERGRIDAALQKAWASYTLLRTGRLTRCPVGPGGLAAEVFAPTLVANIVPSFCAAPRPAPKTFARASTVAGYIDLVREAERRLIAAGHTDVADRTQILSGIYYATDWSRDFDVEKSTTRNAAFQFYTGRSGPGPDPRPILGTSLFSALKASGDVVAPSIGTVDMGHVIIGFNARTSLLARSVTVPTQGATGLEIVTWVGDLGGGAGRLARDRATAPSTPPQKYFTGRTGRDYGADSNLEGDVAGFVGASAGSATVPPPAFTVAGGATIADALSDYFLSPLVLATRTQQFLLMQGGVVSGRRLTNATAVENAMTVKIATFGLWYIGTRYGATAAFSALRTMPAAARAMAQLFVAWLVARLP